MVLVIAILNDGTIMTIAKDRVKPSPLPDSWKLKEIFATGIFLGSYLAVMTVVFFWLVHDSDAFADLFGADSLRDDHGRLVSAVYLQLIATVLAVYANWTFARIAPLGWKWAGIVWIYSVVTYIPLDVIKFGIRAGLGN
ncbi:hypothetical protein AXG93_4324s1010 [Marchantia polymorpha subsp. ruderalis]|uniref:Cation-transporting P-type ATPase C-terminal domain-containing protein n=1 Tax=Marchantia polymorpha subsp. ruderalis TaxID=1480154 RepID=A0A176W1H2_MARPO|nr:hypothetical protein AXG93_4324s1010 [Marchantia polymorpha subsp. ruderalis]